MASCKSKPKKSTKGFLPRLWRLRDAPDYFATNIHRFNKEVRPYLTEIPIGKQGIAFDRLEMDAYIEHYISCFGRPAKYGGIKQWDAKKYRDFRNDMESGESIKKSLDKEFVKALEPARWKRLKRF